MGRQGARPDRQGDAMTTKNDGGQVYPLIGDANTAGFVKLGITRRDWLAGLAMQGLCANPGGPFQANASCGWSLVNCSIENVAAVAYAIADAMIAEGSR